MSTLEFEIRADNTAYSLQGLLTILAKSIANNDTNTDTFSKSIGDNFTSILLPILLVSPVTSLHENVLLLRHF